MNRFENRIEAGRELAAALLDYADRPAVLVLALPRGGVPVAHEVARMLRLPLDVWIVRKLGIPGLDEVAMGAIALGNHEYLDHAMIARVGISDAELRRVRTHEEIELRRRNQLYRGNRPAVRVDGQTVILVDDGLATGASMIVAVQSLRAAGAAEIIVAVPVGPPDTCNQLRKFADHVVCLRQPEFFHGVGMWYDNFTQTSDGEVQALLSAQTWPSGL